MRASFQVWKLSNPILVPSQQNIVIHVKDIIKWKERYTFSFTSEFDLPRRYGDDNLRSISPSPPSAITVGNSFFNCDAFTQRRRAASISRSSKKESWTPFFYLFFFFSPIFSFSFLLFFLFVYFWDTINSWCTLVLVISCWYLFSNDNSAEIGEASSKTTHLYLFCIKKLVHDNLSLCKEKI